MLKLKLILAMLACLIPVAYGENLLPASTNGGEEHQNWIGQTYTVCGSGREGWDICCDDDPQPRTSISITERKTYANNWVGSTGNYAKDFPHYRTEVFSTRTPDGKTLSITYWVSFTYTGIGEILDFEFAGKHYIYQTVSGYFETRVGECPYPDQDGDDIWPRVFWDIIQERKDINKDGKFNVDDPITLAIAYFNILRWSSVNQGNAAPARSDPPAPPRPRPQSVISTWGKIKGGR